MATHSEMVGGAASWGVSENASTGANQLVEGIVTAWNGGEEPVKAPCHNEKGTRVGEVIYDKHRTAECTIQCAARTEPPSYTNLITVNGLTFHVQSWRRSESNQDFVKFNLTLEGWANGFVPQFVTGVSQ